MSWQCKIANSLGGGFSGTPESAWGTGPYNDVISPTVFFGMYGFPDFISLWKHTGRKCILWCGSDITNFVNGYWLDRIGEIKLDPKPLARWINKYCENYVENKVEYEALKRVGVESKIVPSFLGNIEDYEVTYQQKKVPKVYTSVSGDEFTLYGWHLIHQLAGDNPEIEFHLYGNTQEWRSPHDNVIVHGRVSQETMNEEIKKMQGALRLTEMDGFSEIIAKSLLWGQWPVSLIPYEYTLKLHEIWKLKHEKIPNYEGRKHYQRVINNYPWNEKGTLRRSF